MYACMCVSQELISDLFSIASKTQIIQTVSPLPQPTVAIPFWRQLSAHFPSRSHSQRVSVSFCLKRIIYAFIYLWHLVLITYSQMLGTKSEFKSSSLWCPLAMALAANRSRSSRLPPRFNLAIIKHFNRWKIFAILLHQAPVVRPVSETALILRIRHGFGLSFAMLRPFAQWKSGPY